MRASCSVCKCLLYTHTKVNKKERGIRRKKIIEYAPVEEVPERVILAMRWVIAPRKHRNGGFVSGAIAPDKKNKIKTYS